MDFADYVGLIRRRWWLVAVGLVICVVGAAAASYLQPKKYRTSTRLLVSADSKGTNVDEITARQLASQRAVAYSQYATTGPAVNAVIREAGTSSRVSVTANADQNSPFLTLVVESGDPRAAAAVANAYAVVLPRVVNSLDQAPIGSAPPKLSVLESAGIPGRPYSPKPRTNLLVGAVLGLILGFAAALIRETLDATIRRSGDLERATDVSLLGVITKEFNDERLIAVTRPRSRRAEAYRQVRTNLEFTGASGPPRSIVVTSGTPGEGKTTLASNLALISSHAGRDVVVVDADLRRPTLGAQFGIESNVGLSDVLIGRAHLDEVIHELEGERLAVIPSGALPRSPSELLGSTAMVELITELEARYDLVILDCPPVLPVTDALVISVNVGGVVLVARLASATRSSVRRSVSLIKNINANLLGIVANGAIEEEDKAYGYGYGYLTDRKAEREDLIPIPHLQAASRRAAGANAAPRHDDRNEGEKHVDGAEPDEWEYSAGTQLDDEEPGQAAANQGPNEANEEQEPEDLSGDEQLDGSTSVSPAPPPSSQVPPVARPAGEQAEQVARKVPRVRFRKAGTPQ